MDAVTSRLSMGAASVVGLALMLAGCAGLGAPTAQVTPAMAGAIAAHYQATALEEDGLCEDPEFEGRPAFRMLERSDDVAHVRIEYRYRDGTLRDGDVPPRLGTPITTDLTCRGFSQRDLELHRAEGGDWRVVAMSGPTRP